MAMKIYILSEGYTKDDDELSTEFFSLAKAMKAFKKSSYRHVLLNEYEGTPDDPMETYVDTLQEKGA